MIYNHRPYSYIFKGSLRLTNQRPDIPGGIHTSTPFNQILNTIAILRDLNLKTYGWMDEVH